MHTSGDIVICPAKALNHIQTVTQASSQADSEYQCGDLDVPAVVGALKAVDRIANVPTTNYSTHSIRIGGTTTLLSGNTDQLSTKRLGRWVSICY
ncbi:hypothetical protein PC129_g8846 [Phytophthora cactorum]|uniref:Uncharacterized protein n=1 Tax=Phytophthora cactorum TaxID=29920 RepID=A0A329SBQ6_9STRA|nr:hypothetical protein Pcac1_g7683 [Phytophthora cactorum]KAG2829878.1 hypothetical protein PC112_g7912 [Phytophthora cactorum]KAG2856466.1 hypothetical protein PC113_g11547 [Phytophthora cactorum]KAG2910100.1 hypothetical protein PC115_g13039 [Phytophthora cactorum]KAG2913285.1 hypothetical protein PC114_g8576 [Phytophthora cactorum]